MTPAEKALRARIVVALRRRSVVHRQDAHAHSVVTGYIAAHEHEMRARECDTLATHMEHGAWPAAPRAQRRKR